MMCDIKPGDEVVCINPEPRGGGPFWQNNRMPLVRGHVYRVARVISPAEQLALIVAAHPTVRWNVSPQDHLLLVGVVNPTGAGFMSSRFRKVQRRNLTEWLKQETSYDEEINNPAPNKRKKKGQEA